MAESLYQRAARWADGRLPYFFVKHYLRPLQYRGRSQPYDPHTFFDSWYRTAGVSDRTTISDTVSVMNTRYHYDAVECTLIECLTEHGVPKSPRVLDIGSGAGHWIDFYRTVLPESTVAGLELAPPAAETLRHRYHEDPRVSVLVGDVTDPSLDLGGPYDVINAVGVIFHIVRDDLWQQCLVNLSSRLNAGGVMLIGGHFGLTTRNVQFYGRDDYEDRLQMRVGEGEVALIGKRIRSLSHWRRCARNAGLPVIKVHRTRQHPRIPTPENHVLALMKK